MADFDRVAAAQYLDTLFGKAKGHVAVAYKDKGDSWQETQFSWPADRTKILGWAKVHADANVFICPALRQDAHTRKKGDAIPTQWLWADIDWDKVPSSKKATVQQRINTLGTYVVRSGSNDNVHVYVRVDESISVQDHLRLNTGLRDYLYADNKQADNSLLRLAGTTNWKTPEGNSVFPEAMKGGVVPLTELRVLRAFSRVPAMAMAGEGQGGAQWSVVDVSFLPRRVRSFATMSVDQARSRYRTRHRAVLAITRELFKRGLDGDMIHTLMDTFPPAIDKRDEEHGAYDIHKDVENILIKLRAEDDSGEDEDDFPEQTPEDDEEDRQRRFNDDVEREIWRAEVHDAVKMRRAVSRHTEPPEDLSESLTDALSAPPDPVQWLIDGLASPESNVIITGQYKTGKTALMVASLIPALADGHDFLGRFAVDVPEGGLVVGHWNLEMGRSDLMDKYMRNAGIKNTENVKIAHWRGQNVNLLTEPGKDTAVQWLKSRGVRVWTIDSWAQIARMAGVNTNDNDECYALLGAIDEIKLRAGVGTCFMLGHTGRNSDDKASSNGGLNPTRGASAVDEHVDARWVMTKDTADIRYLATEGRDVDVMKATSLQFDESTKRMVMGDQTKSAVAADSLVQEVFSVLSNLDRGVGLNQSNLIKQLRARVKIGANHCKEVIKEAEDGGYIEIRREQQETGGRAQLMHYIAEGQYPDDRTRNATVREVNMASANVRRRRPLAK